MMLRGERDNQLGAEREAAQGPTLGTRERGE